MRWIPTYPKFPNWSCQTPSLDILSTALAYLMHSCHHLVAVGALDQLSLWACGGLYVSSLDQIQTFQTLAKWALANMNYYTNLAHAPGIVPNHASL